ncbi:type IX secretion system protein PorG [Arcticibacter eurypsychrophilus]|uniref:type IX secretion system protein PorG n=1 Tax=Arcticibacter eurypsychrophilus TaxID=1434752 RepID=UPI00084DA517|nr:DUF6089 family protein [Arcticibacter eurypsychrophilus]
MNRAIVTLIVGFIFLAQQEIKAQSWELGVFGGGIGYIGDLNPKNLFQLSNPAYGILVKRNLDPYWSIKLSILHGKIAAADSNSNNSAQILRNLSFFSPLTEISMQGEFNFFNYIPGMSRKKYSPYIFAGGSLALFNPKTRYQGEIVTLNGLKTEGTFYRKYTIAVPYGTGIKYNIVGNWTLGAELGYRTTFTDHLDDVSGNYPDENVNGLSDRSEERFGVVSPYRQGYQRGDSKKRDTYSFLGFTLTYTFITGKCPPVF